MKILLAFFAFLLISSCKQEVEKDVIKLKSNVKPYNVSLANKFVQLPYNCIENEFPYKLSQVLNDSTEINKPKNIHPIFYGCFDWHSSVHGHWLLISLIKKFPNLAIYEEIFKLLDNQFKIEKINQELSFFKTKNNESFERTYGWAWILKLQEELVTWDDPNGKAWSVTLKPLSDMIVVKFKKFLPKLVYPVRSGEHTNTAFALSFAYDYAVATKNESFQKIIKFHSKRLYLKDKNMDLNYEPSGYDFLSPAFQEINLMQKVLHVNQFNDWLTNFLPDIYKTDFKLDVAKINDRTDGKLVHLDGLNFSRAWCLYELASYNSKFEHLIQVADKHLQTGLKSIFDGNYMGEHWLASFANYAYMQAEKSKISNNQYLD